MQKWDKTGVWRLFAYYVGSTLEGKEDLLLSGLKLVLPDPNNKASSNVLPAALWTHGSSGSCSATDMHDERDFLLFCAVVVHSSQIFLNGNKLSTEII